ncbi:MAG: methyltransferase domain-containing protein [Planctomycetes bacterium]|nr:methyltransferase domain-containing protein [Planctomycetota bacterium]MBL7042296.1 methyltransferase domain-containing protein [Pirellulaceae bacterium]
MVPKQNKLMLVILVFAATVFAASGFLYAQDESLKPGINEGYKKQKIEPFIARFENEKRVVVQKRAEILAACQLKAGMIVADVGAGTGLFTRPFAAKVSPNGKVYAVDVTEQFVKHVEKTCREEGLTNVVGVVSKPTSAELPAGSIDLVFTSDTYHHFEYPYKMLASIRGSLRDTGILVIVDRKKADKHVRADQATVKEEVTKAGFQLLEEKDVTESQYLMRFAKSDPNARRMQYTARSREEAVRWQQDLRKQLLGVLKLDELVAKRKEIPLEPVEVSSEDKQNYRLTELEITSAPGRRIRCLVTHPQPYTGLCPAIVCIHGHGGNRRTVYDNDSIYHRFATVLAENGYVTISADVGQHDVKDAKLTLMGERLWDLIRCVDYLESMPQVNRSKLGCAGLSLGGEMAMWLGAMDERMAATVSCGFLTRMDQMEKNHCMCWKLPGLRELVDFADIYALTAPRALQCQNGNQEPPSQFPPSLAREALAEIKLTYKDLGEPGRAVLSVHDGGHEVDVPALRGFLAKHLGQP